MALEDAGLAVEALRRQRAFISVGTTDGESRDLDQLVGVEVAHGHDRLDPDVARRIPAGRLSSAIVCELELTDVEAVTVPTACAAGNYAIGYGYDVVSSGEADVALCGGADAVCRKTFTGFYRLGTIAPERCQPFDRHRRGILTGEGAGILVLESLAAALARGRASTPRCSATRSTATPTIRSRPTATASPAAWRSRTATPACGRRTWTWSRPTAPGRRPTT